MVSICVLDLVSQLRRFSMKLIEETGNFPLSEDTYHLKWCKKNPTTFSSKSGADRPVNAEAKLNPPFIAGEMT